MRWVRLAFVDVLGIEKSVSIPVNELDDAFDGKVTFDGGSIDGFVRGEEVDMVLRPDPATFVVLPWTEDGQVEARLLCDIANARRHAVRRLRRARRSSASSKTRATSCSDAGGARGRVLSVRARSRWLADDAHDRCRLVLRLLRQRPRRGSAARDLRSRSKRWGSRLERAPRARRRPARTRSLGRRLLHGRRPAAHRARRRQAHRRAPRPACDVHAQAARRSGRQRPAHLLRAGRPRRSRAAARDRRTLRSRARLHRGL